MRQHRGFESIQKRIFNSHLLITLAIAIVSASATCSYGQNQWTGNGDGTDWFLQQNWTIGIPGVQTTQRTTFSNEPGDVSGNPFVTNPQSIAINNRIEGIRVRAALVDIDFNGRPMTEVDELQIGSPFAHSALTASKISMRVTRSPGVAVGDDGTAELTLGPGASLLVDNIGFRVFDQSSVNIDGGSVSLIGSSTLRMIDSGGSLFLSGNGVISIGSSPLTNSGTISGDGRILGDIANTINGRISVAENDFLQLTGFDVGTNFGQVDVILGMLEITDATTNNFDGLITGRDGIIRFENGLTNDGGVGFSFGTMDVFGDVDNRATGTVVVTGNSEATFYDDVINNGEFRVSPGSTLVVFGGLSGANGITGGGNVFLEGDLRPGNSPALVEFESDVFLSDNSILEMELDGFLIGDEYDSLDITGTFELKGSLNVVLLPTFNPANGDSFTLINADSLTGDFNDLSLPPLDPGLQWNIDRTSQSFVLSVEPERTLPFAFTIVTGSLDSGGVPELLASDDQYLVMDPMFGPFRYQLIYTVDATSPTDTPSALEFNYESKTFNVIGTVDQKIELFNYDTGQYENIDNRLTTNTDSVVTVTPAGDPTRFVETGTGAMRARISYQNSFSFWVFQFSALFLPYETSVDHIFWSVAP